MKKALLVGLVAGVLVSALSWWVYVVTQQKVFVPEPEPMIEPVQLTELQTDQSATASPQVKGVTTVQPTPACVEKTYTSSKLQLSFEYTTCESEEVSFEVDASKLLERVERDGETLEQVVLESFVKPTSTSLSDIITSTFISRLPSTSQQGCAVVNTTRAELQDSVERSEIRAVGSYQAVATAMLESEAAAQPCGTYGQMLRVGYFEYHPAQMPDRYVFITPMTEQEKVTWSSLRFSQPNQE